MAAHNGSLKDLGEEEGCIFGECDHREVCYSCILRLRRFYEDYRCPSCTVELREVWFTMRNIPFRELCCGPVASKILELGILFDDIDVADKVRAVLSEVRCPECPFQATDLRQLRWHVGSAHGRFFCDICLTSRKVFLREQRLYSKQNLKQHILKGDVELKTSEDGASSAGLVGGHPECKFCHRRFYDTDELFYHMRDTHFYCAICAGRGTLNEFFAVYSDLESHYSSQHFLCPKPECLEKRFIVFADRIELQLHEAEVHAGKKMSAFEKKKARRLDVSFAVKRANRFGEGIDDHADASWAVDEHQAQAGFPALVNSSDSGGRGGRGRGRNVSRASSASKPAPRQPTAMAVERSRDASGAGGGRLLDSGAVQTPSSQTVPLPQRSSAQVPSGVDRMRAQPEGRARPYSFCEFDMQTGSLLRVECSREEFVRRNQMLLELLRTILSEEQGAEFRAESRRFRAGEVSANDFVSHLLDLMDEPAAKRVFRELIAVMPVVSLQRALADAWLARVALERNFPALDGQREPRPSVVRRGSFSEVCPECGERVGSAEWESHAVFHREQRMQRFHRGRQRDGKKTVILRWG